MEQAPSQGLLPLTFLLALGFRTVIDELHAYLTAQGFADSRPAYGFVFYRLSHAPATQSELADYLDISKQAMSEMLEDLLKKGYVQKVPHPTDKRGKLILLAERGWACVRAAEAIISQQERQWSAALGLERYQQLKHDLLRLIMLSNQGNMPEKFRPTW